MAEVPTQYTKQESARSNPAPANDMDQSKPSSKSSLLKHPGLVWVWMGLYTLCLSLFTITQHQVLKSTTYDLGLFDQILWNTSQGRFFESSVKGINYLGDHFTPILVLLSPLYWLWSDAKVLLIVQSIALALPALPLYWLACEKLESVELRATIPLVYLCYPAVSYMNTFDFHPITLVIAPLTFGFYFMEIKAYKRMLFCLALALLVKEEVAITVAMSGVFLLIFSKERKLGLGILLLSGLYALCTFKLFMPYFRVQGAETGFMYLKRYAHLGTDIPSIIQHIALHPIDAIQKTLALSKQNHAIQALYFFLPIAFLPLLSPKHMLLWLPAFFYTFLSSHPLQFHIRYQYSAIFIPYFWVGTVFALGYIDQFIKRKKPESNALLSKIATALLLVGGLVGIILHVMHPLRSSPMEPRKGIKLNTFHQVKKLIPKSASLSTTNALGPHFSQRKHLKFTFAFVQHHSQWAFLEKSPYFPSEYHLVHTLDTRWSGNFHGRLYLLRCKKGYQIKFNKDGFLLLWRDPKHTQRELQWAKDLQKLYIKASQKEKEKILQEITQKANDIALPMVFKALREPQFQLQSIAIQALMSMEVWAGLAVLYRLVKTHPNTQIRKKAYQAFTYLRYKMRRARWDAPCPSPTSKPNPN